MVRVPFRIKNVRNGWMESDGVVTVIDDKIRLQFQSKDSLLGLWKTDVKEIEVALADVEDVRFQRRWTGSGNLIVRFADLKAAAEVPGLDTGAVHLAVARAHAAEAREFASDTNYAAAEARLRRTLA